MLYISQFYTQESSLLRTCNTIAPFPIYQIDIFMTIWALDHELMLLYPTFWPREKYCSIYSSHASGLA